VVQQLNLIIYISRRGTAIEFNFIYISCCGAAIRFNFIYITRCGAAIGFNLFVYHVAVHQLDLIIIIY
jgi:hypothetical protein